MNLSDGSVLPAEDEEDIKGSAGTLYAGTPSPFLPSDNVEWLIQERMAQRQKILYVSLGHISTDSCKSMKVKLFKWTRVSIVHPHRPLPSCTRSSWRWFCILLL